MNDLDPEGASAPSDAELLRRSAKDPEAFGLLYDRHAKAVLRFLARRTGSGELAAELAAETFARAYIHRRRFRDRGAPARAWILGIARHVLSHTLRRQAASTRALRRLGISRLEVDDPSLERIEDLFDSAPLRASLREAMAELAPAVSKALMLRVGQDLPYVEVAERLGCTVGAARVRVARGLTELADKLGER
jgi:RNA polymerase sigma factor (sigma-70 family)